VLDKTALGEGLLYLDLNQGKRKYVWVNQIMERCVLRELLQTGSEWVTKSRKMKWSRLAALMVKARNEFLFAKFVKKRGRTWEAWAQTTL
jgi:hypothetical protein